MKINFMHNDKKNLKKKIAISIGDINGIGAELALISHKEVLKICEPIYIIDRTILKKISKKLNIKIPKDFKTKELKSDIQKKIKVKLRSSKIKKDSGKYSYLSFKKAIKMAENREVDAIVTMPIHKEAWQKAGISYKGHTDMLRDYFQQDAIMMLGCEKMFVGLFTEHIPLKDVVKKLQYKVFLESLLNFYNSIKHLKNSDKIAVLGVNPHSGDNGVLGDEDKIINKAIKKANNILNLNKKIFYGAIVPDIAFTKKNREKFKYFFAIYHDQGLTTLKALYFEESINISLNLPILRVSVDHGTAFDIAYNKKIKKNNLSYINAIKTASLFKI